jgi:hypothetical protein
MRASISCKPLMNLDDRTVLIVENGQLSSAGVKRLLEGDAHLCVISTLFQSEDELIQEIDRRQPEIVVLTADHISAKWPRFRMFFEHQKSFRLLVVDLEEECIDVYDKQKVAVKNASDLLSVVRQGTSR